MLIGRGGRAQGMEVMVERCKDSVLETVPEAGGEDGGTHCEYHRLAQ